jgi:hypothetical protein
MTHYGSWEQLCEERFPKILFVLSQGDRKDESSGYGRAQHMLVVQKQLKDSKYDIC